MDTLLYNVPIIGVIFSVIWLLILIALMRRPKSWWGKGLIGITWFFAAYYLQVFGLLYKFVHMKDILYTLHMLPEEDQTRRANSEKAMKRYGELCKKSGVFIKRKVENVEGVYLMKVRTEAESNPSDTSKDAPDPYGMDTYGDSYIWSFLKNSRYGSSNNSYYDLPNEVWVKSPTIGYDFVETSENSGKVLFKYTLDKRALLEHGFQRYESEFYKKVTIPSHIAQYGVTYEDISTPEDRALWIAGSSLKVIDLKTNEVIAERIGYIVDPSQGLYHGESNTPWARAKNTACPEFPDQSQTHQTIKFVHKVLIPTKGEPK